VSDLAEKIIAAVASMEDIVPSLSAGPRTEAERDLLRVCAAHREIVATYIGAKRTRDGIWKKISDGQQATGDDVREFGKVDAQLAAVGAILEILARGYGIQP
jgi:hypothetical protein